MKALEWISENAGPDAVVLAPVSEGFIVNAIGKRKNVADMNFLLVKDAEVIYDDVMIM